MPKHAWVGDEIFIAGWCFMPDRPVREVHLVLGEERFRCSSGLVRGDVAEAYRQFPGSVVSGFEVRCRPTHPWKGFPVVRAVTDDGTTAELRSGYRLSVRALSGLERMARGARSWRERRLLRAMGRRFATPGVELVGRTPRKALPLRVMCITNELSLTGGPLYFMEVLAELNRRGIIEPRVISPADGPLRREFEREGISVAIRERLSMPANLPRKSIMAAIGMLAQEMRGECFDVVYANTLETFYAMPAARQAGIASFWNIHESEPWREFFGRKAPALSRRDVMECFAAPYRVVFPGAQTRAFFQELESRPCFCVLQYALDVRRIEAAADAPLREAARRRLEVPAGDVVILVVGTVCPRKSQHDLILALGQLPERLQQMVWCFIVGDRPGAYSDALHQMIVRLPPALAGRVTMVRETPETAAYYRAADVFVCTSRMESFPRVTLEAMAFGLPIIGTEIFGVAAQVRPGINGLLYEAGDVRALRGAILALVEDSAMRRQLAGHAPGVLQSLDSFDAMAETYGEILREAAALTGRR